MVSGNYLTVTKNGKEVTVLTGQQLVEKKLMPILKECVGKKHAITRTELLNRCFGKGYNKMELVLLKQFLNRALHHVRSSTKCFIMGRQDEETGEYLYYVPTTKKDVEYFRDRGTKIIKGIHTMMDRCEQSVTERWYNKI